MPNSFQTIPFERGDVDETAATTARPRVDLSSDSARLSKPNLKVVDDRYVAYSAIGLGDPAKPAPAPAAHAQAAPAAASGGATAKAAAKLVVSGYRLVGIGILSLIVFVLVGYVGTSAFYFLSHSWIVPTIISPTDEKVVQGRNELAAAENARGKLETDLHDTQRAIAVEQQFQIEFTKAVREDLAGRKEALDRVKSLAGAARATGSHVRATTSAYAQSFAARQKTEYDAGLIDRGAMMSGTYQVAQISSSNLSLAQKQAELEGQAQDLAHETAALDALLAQQDGAANAMSYDVLKIKRDYEASKLALAKALETRDTLTASLARQDEMIHGLQQSAYLRALDDHAIVALVPYGNLANAGVGTPLYACKLAMVWCHEAGSVLQILPGEVPIRHPHTDSMLRGQMVELRLTDTAAAEDEVLFVGDKPLAF